LLHRELLRGICESDQGFFKLQSCVTNTHTLHANVRNTALEPLECEIHHGNTNAISSQINSAYPKVEWCPPGAHEFPVLS